MLKTLAMLPWLCHTAASCRGYYAYSQAQMVYQSCLGAETFRVTNVYDSLRSYSYNFGAGCRFNSPSPTILARLVSGVNDLRAVQVAVCANTDVDFVCAAVNNTRIVAWPSLLRVIERPVTQEQLSACLGENTTFSDVKIYVGDGPDDGALSVTVICLFVVFFMCGMCSSTHRSSRYGRV
jgi:hypothetical protein